MKSDSEKNPLGRFRKLLHYQLLYWRGWIFILIVTLLSTVFNLLQPFPLKILVDRVFDQKPLGDGIDFILNQIPFAETSRGLLFWVALAGLLIFIVNSALDVILAFSWIRFGQKMVYDLMCDFFSHIQRRSLIFHTKNSVGDLISRVTGDSWAIYTITDSLLFTPLNALVMIIAMVIVMVQINVEMTLISLIAAPVMAIVSVFFGKRIRNVSHRKRQSESRIQSHVQQTLSGMLVVQAFAQEDREQNRFRDHARAIIQAQKRSTLTGGIYNLLTGGVNSLGAGAILYLGAYYVISGKLTVGSLLVFIAYLTTLQAKLKSLIAAYGTFQSAGASVDRVMEVFDTAQEVEDKADAVDLVEVRGNVRFENVSFGYEENRLILKDISFEAHSGQTIALVGATGAGKSTLVSLIPRFFDPLSGRILVDGKDIRDVKLKSLRNQIGIVLQESFLFPMTIAENIAYGRPNAAMEEIRRAAETANAHQFIERLENGYDTIIGERGATLSGGERQRISIARALLKDAPILILDEPTSSLDARTEELLLEALERLMKGRTTFIIAHRLSTIRKADQILVIDNGQIVEKGNHNELIDRKAAYFSLYQTQFGGQQIASKVA